MRKSNSLMKARVLLIYDRKTDGVTYMLQGHEGVNCDNVQSNMDNFVKNDKILRLPNHFSIILEFFRQNIYNLGIWNLTNYAK